jgi:ankyrin repeat protein
LLACVGHYESCKDIALLLLNNRAEINATNYNGETPMHMAMLCDNGYIAELLLTNNAEINSKDNQGRTPVDSALKNDHRQLAYWLRQNGGRE